MPVKRPQRRGAYAPLANYYYLDEKIVEAGERAELLYVRGLAYLAGSHTDGFIADGQVRVISRSMRDVPLRVRQLTENRLWVRDEDRAGYWCAAWLHWNPSKEQIIAGQTRRAGRKKGTETKVD